MLGHLRISNFALLEEIELELGGGLSFLTGETGAGKSILIDAICRLLGARSNQDDVRAGSSKAVIEAIFDAQSLSAAAQGLLKEWEIDQDEETLIVRREILASGRSKTLINNCAVTLQQVRLLAPYLIDLYGQNEHQSLLDGDSQRRLFDDAIGIRGKVEALARTAGEVRALQDEWKALKVREQQRQRNMDILQFQIQEIDSARISEEEEQELRGRKVLLQNAEKINTLCETLLENILNQEDSLIARMKESEKNLQELSRFHKELATDAKRLAGWQEEMSELSQKLDSLNRGLEFEEGSLDQLESRLDILDRLKKKYGPSLKDVLEHSVRSKKELDELLNAEETEKKLLRRIEHQAMEYETLAAEISRARDEGKSGFERQVEKELNQVAMEGCGFGVLLTRQDIETGIEMVERTYPSRGRESVTFQIEPNPGEGFRDLTRIASGGELSRLMLALKVVGQTEGKSPSLIFDEIDAGISGRVAYQIGERLKKLSQEPQVLCVTHLPQVAVFGDHHFHVSKNTKDDRTTTIVENLDEGGRIRELARMLSGSEVTEAALQHARELREQVHETGIAARQ